MEKRGGARVRRDSRCAEAALELDACTGSCPFTREIRMGHYEWQHIGIWILLELFLKELPPRLHFAIASMTSEGHIGRRRLHICHIPALGIERGWAATLVSSSASTRNTSSSQRFLDLLLHKVGGLLGTDVFLQSSLGVRLSRRQTLARDCTEGLGHRADSRKELNVPEPRRSKKATCRLERPGGDDEINWLLAEMDRR